MPTLNIATFASPTVMGAQVYEEAIASRAQAALDGLVDGWDVQRTVLRSLRSSLPGTRRLPMGLTWKGSPRTRRELGRAIYPRRAITHRMKIGIPPSPYCDVLTLHDITPWTFDDELAPPRAAEEEIRRADAIVTVSEFSADAIAERFGVKRPCVIPNGIDQTLLTAQPLTANEREGLGLQDQYVLVAGGASKRKNLEALAAAWAKVHPTMPGVMLALSGPPHPRRTELFSRLPNTRLLGRVDDGLMPGLIASSAGVIVPSLCEGFGLPALEAMAVGVPVVAAQTSSLVEVVEGAGTLVEPTVDGLAEGIHRLREPDSALAEFVRRGRARAEEFTWERSARLHAELWASLA